MVYVKLSFSLFRLRCNNGSTVSAQFIKSSDFIFFFFFGRQSTLRVGQTFSLNISPQALIV